MSDLSVKKQKVLKINRWTATIRNSNERRVKKLLKGILPQYKNIQWNEKRFQYFYLDVLNSLPSRYKQKNSIELSGRLKNEILIDAIHEKLKELLEEIELPQPDKKGQEQANAHLAAPEEIQAESIPPDVAIVQELIDFPQDSEKVVTIFNDLSS